MALADSLADRQLWVAAAISVLMHAALLAALGPGIAGSRPSLLPARRLQVELVEAAPTSAEDRNPPSLVVLSPAAEATPARTRIATAPPAAEKPSEPDAPAPPSSMASRDEPQRLPIGHVDVSTTLTLARLGDALEGRSLSEFNPEVEKPVRPVGALAIDYPRAALEAGRAGSVLAWVQVDVDGSVKEVEIVDGEPEFADSARESLKRAHFLPAQIDGHAVPNFVVLQLDYHIGSRLVPGAITDLGQRPFR